MTKPQNIGPDMAEITIPSTPTCTASKLAAFYNDSCRQASLNLLSHTDLAAPVADISGRCLNKTIQQSWFDIKLYRRDNKTGHGLRLPSSIEKPSPVVTPAKVIKTRKVRIYPNKKQKTKFKQWFGIARLVYNATVNYIKENGKPKGSWKTLAKPIIDSFSQKYVKDTPYQIKKMAVKDCLDACGICTKRAKQTGKGFKLSYRSKKNPRQSCVIYADSIKEAGVLYTLSGRGLRWSETDWLQEEYKDSRLLFENGRWYLCVPVESKTDTFVSDNQRNGDVVAIDPGVRTFATYFSKDGCFGKIGEDSFQRIMNLHWRLDKLISKRAKEKNKKKKRVLTRALGRLRWKIHDLVDELHNKAALFFAENFAVVLLPTFETSRMVRRKGRKRKLRKATVRAMQSFRFYDFGQKLERKCKERGTHCLRVSEAYTSQTNSFTGELMPKLGGAKGFEYDGVWVDRDLNGARNILLRALRDSSVRA